MLHLLHPHQKKKQKNLLMLKQENRLMLLQCATLPRRSCLMQTRARRTAPRAARSPTASTHFLLRLDATLWILLVLLYTLQTMLPDVPTSTQLQLSKHHR